MVASLYAVSHVVLILDGIIEKIKNYYCLEDFCHALNLSVSTDNFYNSKSSYNKEHFDQLKKTT